jgi:hypothetical protein
MEMLLCRWPLGQNVQNPNLILIHSRRNPFDEYQDPMYAVLTAASSEPLTPSNDPLRKTFWMKTYSENEGILEQLEAQNILRRTGRVKKQGYVTLVAVETVLNRGQWAEICSGCGRREQLDDEKPRMLRCGKCNERYYCNKECQTGKLLIYCTYFFFVWIVTKRSADSVPRRGLARSQGRLQETSDGIKVILLPVGDAISDSGDRRGRSRSQHTRSVQRGPRRGWVNLCTLPGTNQLSKRRFA